MNKKDMQKFKKTLEDKRNDLMNVVKTKKERDLIDTEIGDEIDSAAQNSEKELMFELTDNEKVMLDAIEAALRRIEKDTFGACESCGGKIDEKRITALPWVRYCIGCQSKAEKPR